MARSILQRLINSCVKHSNAAHEAQYALDEYCKEHFGMTPSDADCDAIIDVCYGGCGMGSPITAEEFERELKASMARDSRRLI